MTVLKKNEAIALLEIICNNDPALCKIIKRLVELKRSRKLSTHLAQGDLVALTRTTVAGNVTMGSIIIPLTCDPNYNECDLG